MYPPRYRKSSTFSIYEPSRACSLVTKKSRNILDLLSKLDASILFVQVFVEFIDFVFGYSSDRIVNVTYPEGACFTVSC